MIVGLTGGIGSGKTTVAGLLARHGAIVIDSDVVAREVVQPPSPVLDAIREHFGAGVIAADGSLNRSALSRIVFRDSAKRKQLNDLTHPAIVERVFALVGAQPPAAVVVVEVPLLFESSFEKHCQAVITVAAAPEIRRQRLMARDRMPPQEIDARMGAQLKDEDYASKSTFVIRNDGNYAQLEQAVEKLWQRLTKTQQKRPSKN